MEKRGEEEERARDREVIRVDGAQVEKTDAWVMVHHPELGLLLQAVTDDLEEPGLPTGRPVRMCIPLVCRKMGGPPKKQQ